MAVRIDKEPDSVVSTATELGFAVYENIGRILVTGPVANAIYYGSVCLFYIEVSLVVLFLCLFLSVPQPEIMLPFSLICAGFIGVCFLPVIFLHYIHVPLTLLLKIKSNYKNVSFRSGKYMLLLELKASKAQGEHASKGEWLRRFKRQREQQAQQQYEAERDRQLNADYDASGQSNMQERSQYLCPNLPVGYSIEQDGAQVSSVPQRSGGMAPKGTVVEGKSSVTLQREARAEAESAAQLLRTEPHVKVRVNSSRKNAPKPSAVRQPSIR